MDQCTHEVRLQYWKDIINQCQARETGQSAKQWLKENGICEQTYYSGSGGSDRTVSCSCYCHQNSKHDHCFISGYIRQSPDPDTQGGVTCLKMLPASAVL